MVTGKSRRFESVRRIAPGAFSRNPERFCFFAKDLTPLNLDGAWRVVPRSRPRHLICPGWFLPGRSGTRSTIWRQSTCRARSLNAPTKFKVDTKLIGLTRLVRRASGLSGFTITVSRSRRTQVSFFLKKMTPCTTLETPLKLWNRSYCAELILWTSRTGD
jgi:hypothetical protein